jgi:hypothetical protein
VVWRCRGHERASPKAVSVHVGADLAGPQQQRQLPCRTWATEWTAERRRRAGSRACRRFWLRVSQTLSALLPGATSERCYIVYFHLSQMLASFSHSQPRFTDNVRQVTIGRLQFQQYCFQTLRLPCERDRWSGDIEQATAVRDESVVRSSARMPATASHAARPQTPARMPVGHRQVCDTRGALVGAAKGGTTTGDIAMPRRANQVPR